MHHVEVINVRGFHPVADAPDPFIYVGRRVPGMYAGHPLANPYPLPKRATAEQRAECLALYVAWLDRQSKQLLINLADQVRRTGLPLGCWCHPLPCHAHVLAMRVEWILNEQDQGALQEP